ncbi:MAG: cytochrome c peroxidase [Patiriisocius sp.]|jgi:cytochrome c peroxidase
MKLTRTWGISTLLLALAVGSTSCKKDEPTPIVETSQYDALIDVDLLGLETLPPAIDPFDNPNNEAKVELGRFLFWDPIIGGMKDVACVTCHHPDFGYTDGIDLPIGVNGVGLGPDRIEHAGGLNLINGNTHRVPRNAPTILNAAYNGYANASTFDPYDSPHFWDGRKSSFEEQSVMPPTSRAEMRGDAYADSVTFDSIIVRLQNIPEYVDLFSDCFNGGIETVNEQNYKFAMSAFERSISSINSPYDQYISGNLTAITEEQKHGLLLFNGKANCVSCHQGAAFNDGSFHALGIPENPLSPNSEGPEGDTGKDGEYKFKTPTLRNVELTGPYMHNGMFNTLEEVVEFKNNGVSINDNIPVSELEPLDLTTGEKAALVSFLKALTDNDFDKTIPSYVPSGLSVGGDIN